MKSIKFIFASVILMLCSVNIIAQGSIAEAAQLQMGQNQASFLEGDDYNVHQYFKYTATVSGNLEIKGSSASSLGAVDVNGNDISYISFSPDCVIPVKSGNEVYLTVSPNLILEKDSIIYFNAAFHENENAGKGLSPDDPINLNIGTTNYSTKETAGFGEYTCYMEYTAKEDGTLNIAFSAYVISGKYGDNFDDMSGVFTASYNDGRYYGLIPVKKNHKVCISATVYNAMSISLQETDVERGTTPNYPIILQEGDNEVSAEFGEYWYKYEGNGKGGFVSITSEYQLPRGYVRVLSLDQSISYAQSEAGSYNVRFEVSPNASYLVYVYKPEESDEWPDPDHITLEFQNYKKGETINDPQELTANIPVQMPELAGTYYYVLSIPSDSKGQIIEMTTTDKDADLSIYDRRQNLYYAAKGKGRVLMAAMPGVSYMLHVTKAAGAAQLTPVVREMQEGEDILKPITAVVGNNNVQAAENVFYQYTATMTGSITLSVNIPGVTFSFPVSTNPNDGAYVPVVSGKDTKLDVEQGKTYLIHLSGVSEDCIMTLSESQYAPGEVKITAIAVTGNTITIQPNRNNVWYKYVAERDGKMHIKGNFVGDNNTSIFYSMEGSNAQYSINYTVDETDDVLYETTFGIQQGEAVYVHYVSQSDLAGSTITCEVVDFQEGESLQNPYTLQLGDQKQIPAATRNQYQWICIPTKGATSITVTTDRFVTGGIYTSTDVSGNYDVEFVGDENNEIFTAVYESKTPVDKLYVCLTSSFGPVILTATDTSATGIENVTVQEGKVSAVYDLTGKKQNRMNPGINILHMQDGTVRKVILK